MPDLDHPDDLSFCPDCGGRVFRLCPLMGRAARDEGCRPGRGRGPSIKKSHPIRHRKLAARKRESDRAQAIRLVRFAQCDHSARRYLEQFYRRNAFDEARLHRWGGPTFTSPAFGGGAYMAPAAAGVMRGRA